jgi:zinc protease
MGTLLEVLDQAKLDAQRDVVKNERRQRVDNQVFGIQSELVSAAIYPAGHPYSWPVVGSMADLSAASLDDVKEFFTTYYAPSNATIALVGDFEPAAAKAMIARYFGPIPGGRPVTRPAAPPVTLAAEKRLVLEDSRASLPQLSIVWPTVGDASPDQAALSALGSVLTGDRTSRLTKLLVYDRQLATSVRAGQNLWGTVDAGMFTINVTPKGSASLTEIERLVDSTLAALASKPATSAELARFKSFARVFSVLRLDQPLERAEMLLESQVFYGDPNASAKQVEAMLAVTPQDVERVAKRYLGAGRVVLSMVPAGQLAQVAKPNAPYTNVTPKPEPAPRAVAAGSGAMAPAPAPEVRLPALPIQMRTLRNGARVAILEDHARPIVSVSAMIDLPAGIEPEGKEGLQELVGAMLSEGTTTRTADQIADAVAALGSGVSPTGFYTIAANTDRSLALMADMLRRPSFPAEALKRLEGERVTRMRRQREQGSYVAQVVFGNVLYGASHPYNRRATEQSIARITRDDVVSFYQAHYQPANITFVVAGDLTADQAVAKLNAAFGDWKVGSPAKRDIPTPPAPGATTIYLVDRPDSPQSNIIVGTLGPRRDTPDYYAIELMSNTLGGAFTSRINLNLREDKHYTYGANGGFSFRRRGEPGAFTVSTAVSTPTTDSAVVQLMKELRDIRGPRPITPEEFALSQASATKSLPLRLSTLQGRARAVSQIVSDELPLDYYATVIPRFMAVTRDHASAAARTYVDPDRMVITVVGDRRVIEAPLRAANIAPVVVVDQEGRPVK